ncbi:stanley-cup [Carabus blaptoides fortunei]
MSMKRLAILAAVGQGTLNGTSVTLLSSNMTTTSGGGGGRTPGGGSLHGNVNVLLGGAMLSGVILVVFLVCYCCHRNMRKHAPLYPGGSWREPEVPMEVFTLAGQSQRFQGTFTPANRHGPTIAYYIHFTRTKTNGRPYIKTLQSIFGICIIGWRWWWWPVLLLNAWFLDCFPLLLCETRIPLEFSAHTQLAHPPGQFQWEDKQEQHYHFQTILCYESSGLFLSEAQGLDVIVRPPTPGPPPAYDSVVGPQKDKLTAEMSALDPAAVEKQQFNRDETKVDIPSDETGLPSYEAALRIEAGGYV